MVNLDVESINGIAPYRVLKDDATGFYKFETDYGVQYGIRFDVDDLLPFDNIYQFIIANLNNKKSPRGKKLRLTISNIVYAFFEDKANTMLYLCETGDGKQNMRSRLFEAWYKSSERKDLYAYYYAKIMDEEGVLNHASIILRRDNPNFEAIISEFQATVDLLGNKPE